VEENVSTEINEKELPCSSAPRVQEMQMLLPEEVPIKEHLRKEENPPGYTDQRQPAKNKEKNRNIYFRDTGPKEKNTETVSLLSKTHRAQGAV
jgi:hypothetical protein